MPTATESAHAASGPDQRDEAPTGLSRLAFGICLAILLGIFAFVHPLWEPMDMAQMDENILWSYYPIPLLALLALLIERKLRWATFFLESLRLTLVKFVITFLFANVMWAYVTGPPGVPEDGTPDPARVSAGAEPYDGHGRRSGRARGPGGAGGAPVRDRIRRLGAAETRRRRVCAGRRRARQELGGQSSRHQRSRRGRRGVGRGREGSGRGADRGMGV